MVSKNIFTGGLKIFANKADPDPDQLELPDQGLLYLPMNIWYIWSYTSGPNK